MAFSLMNGLGAMGASVAQFAGSAGLELQRSQLSQQAQILADQLATTRETGLQDKRLAAQSGEKALDRTATAANLETTEGGANTRNAATNATSAANNAATNAGALERTKLEVGKPTGELQMARALAGPNATPEDFKDALQTVLSGRSKFTSSPTTQVDPDDPNKTISGVNVFNTRTGETEFRRTDTNPNKGGEGGLGNRAEIMHQRVASAATMAAEAAKNIMELPAGSSTGWLGGRVQGGSLMAAVKESLVNNVTSQDVQSYNVMLAGVARNLSTIETSGLAPNAGFTKSMESVVLKEGDTEITKMRRMAEIRQIVEFGLEPSLANPRLPNVQKEQLRGVIDKIKESIPFTHHDITVLDKSPGKTTMNDVMKARGLSGGTSPGTTAPAPARTDMYGSPTPGGPPPLPPGFRIVQ